ncbi:MAG: hypothetical protein SGJ27_15500 [Candidatus Melainabacteria bacterium]|nr:hypothetical protein [Candidatus Melainabacteria bacterium]
MTQELESEQNRYKVDKTILLAFLIPFCVGGVYFSVLGLGYLKTLPKIIVSVYDQIFTVFLAFADMGLACGIAAVTIVCFYRQVSGAIKQFRLRKSQGKLTTEQ